MNSTSALNTTETGIDPRNIGWDHPNIKWAIIVSLGAGLATAVGGSLSFCPDLLAKVRQATILGVSLALSAGVMLYVSFIEIFAKSFEAILEAGDYTEAGAAAITTTCFFAGMGFCVLLEMLVAWMSKRSGTEHQHVCAAHADVSSATTTTSARCDDEKHSEVTQAAPDTEHIKQASPDEVTVKVVSNEAGYETTATAATRAAPDVLEGELIGNKEEAARLTRMGLMTAAAIAIHNFPEGLATFLATVEDTSLGASLGVAIAIHNIPEGLCVAMPIYYATGSKWRAFGWSLLSGVTEPIGGIFGFAVLQPVFTPVVFGVIFSMVGGMMVFIVCHELLPAAHRYMGDGNKTTAWFVLGMIIMAISLVAFLV